MMTFGAALDNLRACVNTLPEIFPWIPDLSFFSVKHYPLGPPSQPLPSAANTLDAFFFFSNPTTTFRIHLFTTFPRPF